MVELQGITKRYEDGHVALDNVDFRLRSGEFAFLTGRSGAGKTSLLRIISLLERPSAGRVLLGGDDVTRIAARNVPRWRRQMGIVFQDFKLLPKQTVFENVMLPLQVAGTYTRSEMHRRVRAALDKVGLTDRETEYPHELSGGEQQRVAIARAVVSRPALLLADEPTGSVDPESAREIMGLLQQFNRVGVAVLVATHDSQLLDMYSRQFGYPVWELEHGALSDARQ